MFGPNTYFQDYVNICCSHRDKKFFEIFENAKNKFRKKFSLENYDILFIPGSATLGVEAMISSCSKRVEMIGEDGSFKTRWQEMENVYANKPSNEKIGMYCRLETSKSMPFEIRDGNNSFLVDATSAFPYYSVPENTAAFVTCLNKQLGSYVGLAIVCVRKDKWDLFSGDRRMSYLNLERYKQYSEKSQLPATAPTFIFEHLVKILETFNLQEHRNRIDLVSDLIVNAIGKENIIGDARCPVITLKPDVIPEHFAQKYDLYGSWVGRPCYQIFTYSDTIEQYKAFLEDYKQNIKNQNFTANNS